MTLPIRRLDDPRTIRAIAHPLRLQLLRHLLVHDTLTASQASELVDESPASCSFHFRQLAKYGYVEPAEGGTGRERPWKAVVEVTEIRDHELSPEARIAADEFGRALTAELDRQYDHFSRTRATFPEDWQEAAAVTNGVLFATAAELAELKELVRERAFAWAARDADPALRPPGSEPIALAFRAFPLHRPGDEPAPRTAASAPPAPASPARRAKDAATTPREAAAKGKR